DTNLAKDTNPALHTGAAVCDTAVPHGNTINRTAYEEQLHRGLDNPHGNELVGGAAVSDNKDNLYQTTTPATGVTKPTTGLAGGNLAHPAPAGPTGTSNIPTFSQNIPPTAAGTVPTAYAVDSQGAYDQHGHHLGRQAAAVAGSAAAAESAHHHHNKEKEQERDLTRAQEQQAATAGVNTAMHHQQGTNVLPKHQQGYNEVGAVVTPPTSATTATTTTHRPDTQAASGLGQQQGMASGLGQQQGMASGLGQQQGMASGLGQQPGM
ncbi:hypothetical protein BGZ98_006315, partial [Dissophora globulifera]